MHAPTILGGYPLVLRDPDNVNPRKGELLFDYDTDDLMYSDRETGEVKSVAKDIYDKLISTRIENSNIEICRSEESEGIEPIIPVENRAMNAWYMTIESRTPIEE